MQLVDNYSDLIALISMIIIVCCRLIISGEKFEILCDDALPSWDRVPCQDDPNEFLPSKEELVCIRDEMRTLLSP